MFILGSLTLNLMNLSLLGLIGKGLAMAPAINSTNLSPLLEEAYKVHKIVPEVVDRFEPHGLLTIEYGPESLVTLANMLKVADTQEMPKIQFTFNSLNQEQELQEDDKFLLVLTDLDAPSTSDHKASEFCHWVAKDLVLNPNNAEHQNLLTVLDLSQATHIIPYVGPGPPLGSGKHRYVFLLYKQDPNAEFAAPSGRPTWGTGTPGLGVRNWIKEHGGSSQLLGVNFFFAQNEND